VKVGDLVRFKQSVYAELYGVGLILGPRHRDTRRPQLRILFNGEQIIARFDELEVISESR
jgi:hypothetical protein